MIPFLPAPVLTNETYIQFCQALKAQGFSGELCPDYANRIALSTDNSIYQVLPQVVIYPKNNSDIQTLCRLACEEPYQHIVLTPRGGGTGTNGQSLTDGIVIDLSKHLNKIIEINPEEKWARVQGGVVKDHLNAELKKHGLFFAPELSTSNRATIGGMINTDASGQGSCLYGKTRDHVLALKTCLLGGELIETQPGIAEAVGENAKAEELKSQLKLVVDQHAQLIQEKFPKLNRCLTGYDLAHFYTKNGDIDINAILCGSEGTLGFITEATLNVLPIPSHSALIAINYRDFISGLRDAQFLMSGRPTSIETIDSKVFQLAKDDIIWHDVKAFFHHSATLAQGINLVELTASGESELAQGVERIQQLLEQDDNEHRIGFSVIHGSDNVKKIWAMRKKAVGLLGNAQGSRRPVPFVEDTAVPPENLADFIEEFRALLDRHELSYGMFGHVDAGVLHVRPALDMKISEDEQLIRPISDGVVALVKKYRGLLWGEHGKGVRSEYAPEFFGPLYPALQQVKALFDPRNQLNPGKIATPSNEYKLLAIDGVPTRGMSDRRIEQENWQLMDEALYCNGNGACHNYQFTDPMCPSWKGTRERIHTPKGRSSLIREWVTQLSDEGVKLDALTREVRRQPFLPSLWSRWKNGGVKNGKGTDFSHEVYEAMAGCLACKSCVGQCPIKVDIPSVRAKFLEIYHSRYLRPMKDYVIGALEFMVPTLAKFPQPYNWMMNNNVIKGVLARYVGMVDSPLIDQNSLANYCRVNGIKTVSKSLLSSLDERSKAKTVVIVQDAFTSFFESQVVIAHIELLEQLGLNVFMAPYMPNGKPLHVHGFLKTFTKVATKQARMLDEIQRAGVAMIGVDPSMTLTYRSEYPKYVAQKMVANVQLPQEFLADYLEAAEIELTLPEQQWSLLGHCTEKTNAPVAYKAWQAVFSHLGQHLELAEAGCCGMSGTYGHEARNVETSKHIYNLSWQLHIKQAGEKKLLATGYSCRSQVKRIDDVRIAHPIEALNTLLKAV